jgi:hypothetical protein
MDYKYDWEESVQPTAVVNNETTNEKVNKT